MSPRTPEQLEELRQQRRSDIMEAAIQLFAHRGFEATSISQIAKKAGISKGLIYNYFDDKEALLDELIMGSIQKLSFMFESHEVTEETAAEILKAYLLDIKNSVEAEPEYWRLYSQMGVQLIDRTEDLEKRFANELEQYNKNMMVILGYLQPEVPTKRALAMFNATLDGLILHQLMNPHFPTDDIYEHFYQQITGSTLEE
ncbi:MAG: TetR/AcrR family transcriptional regulator [Bacteroidota bacterium]